MRFYTQTHQDVCGVDLHSKTLYLCILNHSGEIVYDPRKNQGRISRP